MPRRRNLSVAQQKRPLEKEEEGARLAQKKIKVGSDIGDLEVEVVEISSHSGTGDKSAGEGVGGTVDEKQESKDDNSETDDETESRERSLSTSSSSGQRNRSLEALFQVTDTELQAISKQGPDEQNIIQIENDNQVETVFVIDSVIQEREELVGEPEVLQEEIHLPVAHSPDSSDETESYAPHKRLSLPLSHAGSSKAEPSTSEQEVIDTPKWRQFKNIERILQNAGIDTSSKTWLTLTRPGRHICPYCQRACTKPSVLEKHIRAHTGERPYPCLVCGFSFKTKSNLYKHCKSRAHTLKTNVEAKKLQAQGLTDSSGNVFDVQTTVASELFEGEKKKMEPAQRHVIQEVVKYLEKGKSQRPNEVHTERQRAKLERLKSLQEKTSTDLKKKEENKTILQRQLSLPVLPANYFTKEPQFQKIAPKGFDPNEGSSSGEVKDLTKILVPGTFLVNEKGEVLQKVSNVEKVVPTCVHVVESKSAAGDDHLFYNQIEIVNLPDPDTDPETSTKALHDLEELSEKFSKAARDGLRLSTAVQSLPDKRVQVVLQLQHPAKLSGKKKSVTSGDEQMPRTPVLSRSISSIALKERIQKLISANAAIVDTPKVEPPRAKCIKRNMSRQDSDSMVHVQSETETAVSRLLMPSVNSVSMQPLLQEQEIMLQGQRELRSNQETLVNKKQNKKIVVEKIEYEGEDVLIINNDMSDDEHIAYDSPRKLCADSIGVNNHDLSAVFSADTTTMLSGSHEFGDRSVVNQLSGKGLRTGLELPLTTTNLPVSSRSILTSHLNQCAKLSGPMQTVPFVRGHKSTSSVIMSPIVVGSSPQKPGQIGKVALRNLQMKSRSLSTDASTTATHIKDTNQSIVQASGDASATYATQSLVQYTVESPGQASLQYTVHPPGQVSTQCIAQTANQVPPQQYTVQTNGQGPSYYNVLTQDQGHSQYTVQTPGQGPSHCTIQTPVEVPTQCTGQTPGQAPTQLTIQTHGHTQSRYIVQTPGQTPSQYVLQTPTTPVAQVLIPGSSLPVLFLGGPASTHVQSLTQPEQQSLILQQTEKKLSQNVTPVLIQTPRKITSQQLTNDSCQAYVVHQDTRISSSPQTVLAGQPSSAVDITNKTSMHVSPSTQTDPLKILSSIVSNTVNQQKLMNQTLVQQPKEIKIEIKLPPPLQNYSTVQQTSNVSALNKSRPPLKRQNPVPLVHSPLDTTESPKLNSLNPVFRFSNVVNTQKSASNGSILRPNKSPFKSDCQTITSTASKMQTSVIKEFLLRGKSHGASEAGMFSTFSKAANVSENRQILFFCPHCHISFKKKETLDLHVFCYCKNKNQASETTARNDSLSSSEIQTEIVSKLFTQSKDGQADNELNHKSDKISLSQDDCGKNQVKSILKSRIEYLNDLPTDKKRRFELSLGRSKSVIMSRKISTVGKITAEEIELPIRPLPSKIQQTKEDKTKESEEKMQKPGIAKKDMWQSKLRGQILKRKLKGKLLTRSLSVDNKKSKIDNFLNKVGIKTRIVNTALCQDPLPVQKPKLIDSYDDTSPDDSATKRPVFRRSKSVPELLKDKDKSFEDKKLLERIVKDQNERPCGKESNKSEEKKEWQLDALSVPVVTADMVIQSVCPVKPIYQQNFHMKSFEGMGTPIQLVPSATLTPRPELMEIEKVRKMFSFESGSLKLVHPIDPENDSLTKSPLKSPLIKLSVLTSSGISDTGSVTPHSPLQSPIKSPQLSNIQSPLTPRKSPNVHQFSLVGHTYPSMRSITHLTFCCVDRLQPSYVRAGKKISMYSNWRIAEQNTNPLGLATRTLLSLYNSRYTTNPVLVTNCGADLRSGAITHSSYWKVKHGGKDIDAVFSLIELTDFGIEKEKKIEVGYKTSEESVYVRGRGRGKYVCETCGIRCKKPSMLKKHIRTHTDLRPYKCKHCKFSFKTKGNLQKHMKSKSHYKKCLDLGISPVPTAVDESQIDEEALQAQCYLSKRAKIVDKLHRSVDTTDKDTNTTDDNEEDGEEDDYKKMEYDDDDDDDDDDDNFEENVEAQVDVSVDINKTDDEDGKEDFELKDSVIVSESREPGVAQTQHNLFLQSLGIIAKHQLTGDQVGSQPQLMGTRSLQLPTVSSIRVNLDGLNQTGAQKKVQSDGSLPQGSNTASLSTVYGKFRLENEDETSINKDSDVIWGLLNLSDQSQSPSYNSRSMETSKPSSPDTQANKDKLSSIQTNRSDVNAAGTRMRLKIPQALDFLPPYLSATVKMADTAELGSSRNGPIIGQIIRNVTASARQNTSEKSNLSTVFMPFQFQHPFPGRPAVVMSSTVVTSQTVEENALLTSDQIIKDNKATSIVTIPHNSKNSCDNEVMYVQIGDTKGEIDTIQAQIVNIDPEVFRSRGNQKNSLLVDATEIPLENVLQLRKVSEGLYVITSENEPGKGTQQRHSQLSVMSSGSDELSGHVTGSAGHATSDGLLGRFVCSICRASFEEHHQLILHGNVHFLENSRLKCASCSQKFRSHSALDKHLKSDHNSDITMIKKSVTDSLEPRPHKCVPCDTAFRLKGHLTKHFRSRAHFKNLEALGKLPIGTWEKLEHKVCDIDANTVEEFLAKVDILLHVGSSANQSSWSHGEVIMDADEVFIENDGSEKVRVEVNEQPFEFGAIGETGKYRGFPLPEVYAEDNQKSDIGLTADMTVATEDSHRMKPHKCGLCGRGFKTVSELKSHLITHAELRPYVCEFCDAGFTNAQSLKIHLYTHTQETPYICGMCGMKFPNTSRLSEHCITSHPPPGRNQPTALATEPNIPSEWRRSLVTIATVPVSSQAVDKSSVSMTATAHSLSDYNYPFENIEKTLKTESDPQLPVITFDRKSVERTEDNSYMLGTDSSAIHREVNIATSSDHCISELTTSVAETTECSETSIYLTEQLSNTNVNDIVYSESSEHDHFAVSMAPTASSDIISEIVAQPKQAEELFLASSSAMDHIRVNLMAPVEFSSIRSEKDSSTEQALVAMKIDRTAEDSETNFYSKFVQMETKEMEVELPV